MEEFQEIFKTLDLNEQSKVKSILANYQIKKSDFCDKWSTIDYNLNRENNGHHSNQNGRKSNALQILNEMEDKLQEEGK